MYYSLDHPSAVMQQVQYPSAPTKVLYHATATANIWGVLSRGLVLPWQVGCSVLVFILGAFHEQDFISYKFKGLNFDYKKRLPDKIPNQVENELGIIRRDHGRLGRGIYFSENPM